MRNDIRMTSLTQKTICEYFNGDIPDSVYGYRSGGYLVDMYTDRFGTPNLQAGPSRWTLCDDTIEYMYANGRINEFFTTMLSLRNISKELHQSNQAVAAEKRKEAITQINNYLIQDDLELIEIGSTLILHQIEDYSDFVGCGGFANVYRIPGTDMVVKKLKDEFKGNDGIVSRFKQEFYLINEKLLGIKGIIEAYEYNADEISYTMKFYSADLKKYIDNANLDEARQIELILEILEIMRQVHERRVWHRDLSPKNIFIQDGHPIIADFGLGKAIDENGRTYVTIDTSCNGTLEYCDPRQFQGLKFADAQSDIYSLGRIINYIMTKDSDNFKHKLSLISTIATQSSLDARFHNVQEMIDKIKRTTKAYKDAAYDLRCEQLLETDFYDNSMDEYLLAFDEDDLLDQLNKPKFFKAYKNVIAKVEYDAVAQAKFGALHDIFNNPIGHTFAKFDAASNFCVTMLREHRELSDALKAIMGTCIYDVTVGMTRWGAQRVFSENVRYLEPYFVQETTDAMNNGWR